MKLGQIATASPMPQAAPAVCRGNTSESRETARLIIETTGTCAPRVVREYMPPWHPRKGAFVSCENGWGQKVRAEIVCVPAHPQGVHSFGVRLFAFQSEGPYHWLSMSTRWVLWREEA